MTDTTAFLCAAEEIAAENPVYRTGGWGADGTCDCVGLIMGALRRCGQAAFPMHSSNWFARSCLRDVRPLEEEEALQPGMAVLRCRASGEAGWDLNARYLSGGRYFNGDLTDYYHIGIVISADPVTILHCTSPDGIRREKGAKGWHCFGVISALGEENVRGTESIITCPQGDTVNLRKRPAIRSELLGRVRRGATVTLLSRENGWGRVRTASGLEGYIMAPFLETAAPAAPPLNKLIDELLERVEEMDLKLDRLLGDLALYLYNREEE